MKESTRNISKTRRRFLAMLGVLGTMLALPARGNIKSRLSRHEASFYRKGRIDNT